MSTIEANEYQALTAEEGLAELKRLIEMGGRVETARALSRSLAARYPENEAIQRWARVIAPPRVIGTSPASGIGTAESIQWIKNHRGEHSGKWVALRAGELLAADLDREAVLTRLAELAVDLRGVLLYHLRS